MELRHLRAFIVLADELHFGRAAARLFVSPPGLTQQIQQLERQAGVRLFERTPVALTDAGRSLLPIAREVIAGAERAEQLLRATSNRRTALLRVGVMAHGSGELTTTILREFRQLQPSVLVTITSLDFTQHFAALLARHVDIAFVRPALGDPRFRELVLTTEERILIVPDTHRFAEAAMISVDDVLDESFIGLPPAVPAGYADFLYFNADRNGTEPRTSEHAARNPVEILSTVAAGLGVASSVASFASYYPWPGVRHVPVTDATTATTAVIARADDQRPVIELFFSVAAEALRRRGARQSRPRRSKTC
ncbi:MAG: LysR family transcriptional regulator, benzoate and cis,cis-muconate-responsive activator of ben [Acidimicrobiia bacterium]|nr:LysR family transcriptional regulator, benzoate and cis,cis-muconate-responsive activator of ben [Acidimicrobiia bacterium]